jgi:glycosyltransferase involved in cell wall biosynthesis
MLIRAFMEFKKSFPDYKLEIYGDGDEKENILKMINELNAGETIKLFPATNKIHEIAVNKAMFVSTSDYEGLSNSMLEALAIGLPTICTDCPCGGARMVINDGKNGRLVKPGDIDQLTEIMKQIASNEELARAYSQKAVEVRDKYSMNNIFKLWEDLTR